MSNPEITVVIPHYNRSHFLVQTLNSIKNQTLQNWQVIIIDDGSNDEPKTLIEEFLKDERISFHLKPENRIKGPSASRNLGVEMSNASLIMFLDSDDLIVEHCLQERVAFMNHNETVDLGVFPQGQFHTTIGDEASLFSSKYENLQAYLNAFIADRPPWQTSAPVWRKTSFQSLGGFDENLTCMEDPDIHIRAILNKLNIGFSQTDQPDFFYRIPQRDGLSSKGFWENSIKGRFMYWPKLIELLRKADLLEKSKSALLEALHNFHVHFLFARVEQYQHQIIAYHDLLLNDGILDESNHRKYNLIFSLRNSVWSKIPGVKRLLFAGL